jgi:penicillin-binding protein 2
MVSKKYHVKKSAADIEPHEVFLDTMAKNKEEQVGISGKKLEVPLKNQMSYALFGVFVLLALVLFGKTFYYQVFEGKQLVIVAENNMGSRNTIPAPRGIIYDSTGQQLVFNSPAYDLLCDRNYFSESSPAVSQTANQLSEALNITPQAFLGVIQAATTAEVPVSENLSHDQLLAVESKIPLVQGCQLSQNTVRSYPDGTAFAQVLGYESRITQAEYQKSSGYSINDTVGQTGLEEEYESYLKGTPGQSNPKDTTQPLVQPAAGDNLVLNINAQMQQLLYNSLQQKLQQIGAQRGAAVVMNPQNGQILAIVSYPSYDDNEFAQGITQAQYSALVNDPNQPLFNRAISAKYPTGSIIKPLEASAALQEQTIPPLKQIWDPGYILVPSQNDPSVTYRFGGVEPHGWVDMRKALAVSSNIYFYTVGGGYGDQVGLGPTRIKQYLTDFGWDNKTGIDLPGEFGGFIPDPAWKLKTKGTSWYSGDTYNLSIGQSDLETTPLQVAVAYSAIANGGTLYQPQLVNKIVSGTGDNETTVKQFTSQVMGSNFIDPQYLQIVRNGMRDGVTQDYGLSRSLNNLPVPVAAKTGTAQIGYANKFNLWSATFAPFNNPQLVVVVTAEAVNALGAVTLPVSHDVLSWYYGPTGPGYSQVSSSQSMAGYTLPAVDNGPGK